MTVYSVSVKSTISIINKKTRLEDVDIRTDGFRDNKSLSEFKKSYNEDRDIKDHKYESRNDWRISIWYSLFEDMRRALSRWRRRRYKENYLE